MLISSVTSPPPHPTPPLICEVHPKATLNIRMGASPPYTQAQMPAPLDSPPSPLELSHFYPD